MPNTIRGHVRPAVVLTLSLCLVTGVLYPAAVTGLAQTLFPAQANGSLVVANGRVVGSALIGQRFTRPDYFHPRPSAAGDGYDASASGGSNAGPTSRALAAAIRARVDSVRARDGVRGAVPADLVTASGSGLDPHVTPASAFVQVARVARARALDTAVVRTLVERHVEGRQFLFFGEPRVNVLLLNVALDSLTRAARVGRRAVGPTGS